MNVRLATSEDIPRIAPCAREFCQALDWPLNEEVFLRQMAEVVAAGSGAVFLLEKDGEVVGGLGGTLNADRISGIVMAVEVFWYVRPAFRVGIGPIRLITYWEHWARSKGAKHICMISMEKSMPAEMDRLYTRLGYRKLETTYIK